jgi:gliding motility-associated-like protein
MRYTNIVNSAFIGKFNPNSTISWLKEFKNCDFEKTVIDSDCNSYVLGQTKDTLTTNLGQIIGSFANRTYFILKFDSNGTLNKLVNLGFTTSSVSVLNLKIDNFNQIYLMGYYLANFNILGTLVTKNGNGGSGFLAKINLESGNLTYSKTATSCNFVDITFDEFGAIYLTGTLTGGMGNSSFGTINLTAIQNDIFIAKLVESGNYSWVKKAGGNQQDQSNGISYFGGKLYFYGSIIGTVNFDGLSKTSIPANTQNGFIAVADTVGNILKVRICNSNASTFSNLQINSDGNILAMGVFSDKLFYDNFQLSTSINNCLYISKIDTSLNGLWFLSLNSTGSLANCLASQNREYYFAGSMYASSMQFGPFYRFFNISNNNGFLVKLSDITIATQAPNQTNFCSGEQFNVNYETTGKFIPGNTFSVYLTDSSGTIDSLTSIKIGSKQDTISGIINCQMPNSIIQSKKYKLRIQSNAPIVNSFIDTSTISILTYPSIIHYPDTFVCYGSQINLGSNLTIAQKYEWNWGSTVLDSTKQQVLTKPFLPPQSKQYILKASNQLCSSFDSFWVQYKAPLHLQIVEDTLVCANANFEITPFIMGGKDSLSRNLFWFKSNWTSPPFLGEKLSTSLTNSDTFFVLLSDNCSLPDSAMVSVKTANYRQLNLFQDTLICLNQSIHISPNNLVQDTLGYKLTWTDNNWNFLSQGDTLKLNPNQNSSYYLISEHFCHVGADTSQVFINISKPIQFNLMQDTSLCLGDTFSIYCNASGGKPWSYKIAWSNGVFDSINQFRFEPNDQKYYYQLKHQADANENLKVSFSEACSNPIIDSIQIQIPAKLNLQIEAQKVCLGLPTNLIASTQGGRSPFHYFWKTLPNKLPILQKDSFALLNALDTSFFIQVSDACGTSDSLDFHYLPFEKPIANFDFETILRTPAQEQVQFNNLSISLDPSNYYWKFGEFETSIEKNPIHNFSQSGNFWVKLLVQSKELCIDSISKLLAIELPTSNEVYLPNAITLNNNGINEVFAPIGLDIENWQMEIYDRWGISISTTNQATGGFRGIDKNGNEVPIGVYFYSVTIQTKYGNSFSKKGSVTLLR